MLILSRRIGESIMIGDDVTVTVLAIKGNQLRLGFTAPTNVTVHREEVYERIQAERLENTLKLGTNGRLPSGTIASPEVESAPQITAVLKIRSA